MTTFAKMAAIAALILLSGCSSQESHRRTAQREAELGWQAMERNEWESARAAFGRAAAAADAGDVPARGRSAMYYEYGRASGARCRFDESEAALKTALALEEVSGGPIEEPLIELARLNLDLGKYAAALPYFERGLNVIRMFEGEVLKRDPGGYALLLDEYALAASKVGDEAGAEPLRERAQRIRGRYPDTPPKTERTPYGKHCDRKQ